MSVKHQNEDRGQRRHKIEREEVVSNLPICIVIVVLEVDDGDEPEEDM